MSESQPLSLEQLRALNNPVRLEVLGALRQYGPLNVNQLASKIGKEERLLYYHLKKLLSTGLVDVAEVRPGKTRPESIFRARGHGHVDGIDLTNEEIRRTVKKSVRVILRTAEKEYFGAVDLLSSTAFEDCRVGRISSRLNSEDKKELMRRIDELTAWLLSRDDADGQPTVCTLLVTPQVTR